MPGLSIPEIADAIGDVPLFSALGEAEVSQLLDACPARHMFAGSQIFSSYQQADSFYVILAGRVKVYKTSAKGDEQILHLYQRGNTFGEAAMWAGISYPASAETLEDSTLMVVGRGALKKLIGNNSDLALAMFAGMSAKLREFNQLIEQLSLKDVPARLAGVLLELPAKPGTDTIVLKQTKREIAARIGTVAETLSRALKKLQSAGIIEVKGPEITILDVDALCQIAEQ